MTETTVTEALRGLLAEGFTSGEIIAKGYRPGTVYKVQRSLRLAAALAPELPAAAAADETEDPEEPSRGPEDEFEDGESEDDESTEDRIAELEAELGRVDQELRELREFVEGRFQNIMSRFSNVWLDLSRINGQVPQMETEFRWLREAAEDATTLLAPQTMEPTDPREWRYPAYMARARVRRRLVEINPAAADALFGDRIEQVLSGGGGLADLPPKRKKWGERVTA